MKRGVVDVLLTAPINKHNIQNEDFHFPGHTEYLEKCFGGLDKKALMILMKDDLRVALVTIADAIVPIFAIPSQRPALPRQAISYDWLSPVILLSPTH